MPRTSAITREELRERFRENAREIITHFNRSQSDQNRRLDEMDSKLDAIMEMLATRQELRNVVSNLVRTLKAKGIEIDESKLFLVQGR